MGIELIQNGNQFVLHTRTADFAMEACHHFQNNMVLQLTGQPVIEKAYQIVYILSKRCTIHITHPKCHSAALK